MWDSPPWVWATFRWNNVNRSPGSRASTYQHMTAPFGVRSPIRSVATSGNRPKAQDQSENRGAGKWDQK
jgi:hypothetical protein